MNHLGRCWVSLITAAGEVLKIGRGSTQPCILEEVVDRPNLGQKRPPRSKGHHNNLHDKTRTVAPSQSRNQSSVKQIDRIGQG